MGDFYKNLADGKNIAQSIHQAKLEFVARSDEYLAHPYYWSSFVPLGDMSLIEVEARRQFFPLIILLVGAVAAAIIVYRKRIRSHR